jgi:hypothetical protein
MASPLLDGLLAACEGVADDEAEAALTALADEPLPFPDEITASNAEARARHEACWPTSGLQEIEGY